MDTMKAYEILGLPQSATEEEVKMAYKALAQKYNPDIYEAGPLHDDAAQRMAEVNEAFDTVMGALRTGTAQPSAAGYTSSSTSSNSTYANIRTLINAGQADAALQQLNTIPNGNADAEWNFLVGSAYYYKGWVNDAARYFQTANSLEPANREYEAALRNLQNSAQGNMNGNPYAGQRNAAMGGMGCSCCDMCTAMICMDMCCGC